VKFTPRKVGLKTTFRPWEENLIFLNRPLRTTFLLVPERLGHFLDFFDESALVTLLIKIHPQTKQKHKEVQNKPRGVGKVPWFVVGPPKMYHDPQFGPLVAKRSSNRASGGGYPPETPSEPTWGS
jgi:hypothetical protein